MDGITHPNATNIINVKVKWYKNEPFCAVNGDFTINFHLNIHNFFPHDIQNNRVCSNDLIATIDNVGLLNELLTFRLLCRIAPTSKTSVYQEDNFKKIPRWTCGAKPTNRISAQCCYVIILINGTLDILYSE